MLSESHTENTHVRNLAIAIQLPNTFFHLITVTSFNTVDLFEVSQKYGSLECEPSSTSPH